MKNPSAVSKLVGVSLVALLGLSACGGGQGGGSGGGTPTPEEAAYEYRHSVMEVAAYKLGTVGGMARGEIPLDEAVFVKAAKDLATVAGMYTEGFMPQGMPAGSRALPEIWQNWADFQQKAEDSRSALEGVANAAATGGFAAAQGLVQAAAGNCGACHRVYRQRTE